MDAILVLNAGSSSLKFQIFRIARGVPARSIRGQLEGIGIRPRLRAQTARGEQLVDSLCDPAEVPDLPAAIARVQEWLRSLPEFRFIALGHRVVHGGPDFDHPVLIDEAVLARLAAFQALAPLHQPNNLAPIRRAMELDPSVPQVACFDTSFHRGHPEQADWYALPARLHDEGVRRYGFHGLSYEYVAERLRTVAPECAMGRVIVAHLGSGASMCALHRGRSVESSMGFTALDGLPMGTRPGQLDPGIVLYLIEQRGMSASEVSDLLYRESGLKGLSGISSDMRVLLASDAPAAAFAVEHFVYRCALNAGMLVAALGGLDAFVFTAGIGENGPRIRSGIMERLSWLGVTLDAEANARGATRISTADSKVGAYVIPTDEELMIARHTLAILGGAGAGT